MISRGLSLSPLVGENRSYLRNVSQLPTIISEARVAIFLSMTFLAILIAAPNLAWLSFLSRLSSFLLSW